MLEEEESLSSINEEICVFCRQPLNNELNNYYGKICYLLRDFFIDISKNKEKDSRKKILDLLLAHIKFISIVIPNFKLP